MNNKPVVLVTRKLTDSVEQKLEMHFSVMLNPDDRLYSSDELLKLAENVDAIGYIDSKYVDNKIKVILTIP